MLFRIKCLKELLERSYILVFLVALIHQYKANTRFNADIAFVMEIAYIAAPLKRLRFFYAISTPSPIRARQCRSSGS